MRSIVLAAVMATAACGAAQAQDTPPPGAASPTAGRQLEGPADDCGFLEQAFQEVYAGLRQQPGQGRIGSAPATENPQLVTMYLMIQSNIIQMHTAAGCETTNIIAIARNEAARYSDGGR